MRRALRLEGNLLFVDHKPYDLKDFDRLWIVGGGKAGAPMAASLCDLLGERITGGAINVKYGHLLPPEQNCGNTAVGREDQEKVPFTLIRYSDGFDLKALMTKLGHPPHSPREWLFPRLQPTELRRAGLRLQKGGGKVRLNSPGGYRRG